jgi:hypothetical protein
MKFSESFETTERSEGVEQSYLEGLEHGLEAEIERIIKEEIKLGEGRTARVFSIAEARFPIPVCVKIWKPDVLKLEKQSPVEFHKLQAVSPEEEFDLQDELYLKGFEHMPIPIAFGNIDDVQVLAMEELPGYTLEQIEAAGATIEGAEWKDLERLIYDLNIQKGVVHRDLGKQNIFLKTTEPLVPGGTISGEVNVIDFGLSKRVWGAPEPEDYSLTIGKDMIRYPSDRSYVEALKPLRGQHNLFAR